jgi:hypothetical protein
MKTATRRDQAHRLQPSLLDLPVDEGKKSRDETFQEVLPHIRDDQNKWLARIIAAGPKGITAFELSEKYKTPQNVFSGRLTELAKLGKIVRTSERRPTVTSTSAVIVAADFLHATRSERAEQQPTGPSRRPVRNEDTMPDALTNPKAQRDSCGHLLVNGADYSIYDAGGRLVAGHVRVSEDDFGTQYVVKMSSPDARPQRIDEMTKGMRWERLK